MAQSSCDSAALARCLQNAQKGYNACVVLCPAGDAGAACRTDCETVRTAARRRCRRRFGRRAGETCCSGSCVATDQCCSGQPIASGEICCTDGPCAAGKSCLPPDGRCGCTKQCPGNQICCGSDQCLTPGYAWCAGVAKDGTGNPCPCGQRWCPNTDSDGNPVASGKGHCCRFSSTDPSKNDFCCGNYCCKENDDTCKCPGGKTGGIVPDSSCS